MRVAIAVAAVALALPAVAQQPRQPSRPPQPPAQQQAPEPPPGLFACRTAAEVCFIGIVTGNNQVAILFTNAPPAAAPAPAPQAPRSGPAARAPQAAQAPQNQDMGDKPIDVLAGDPPGTPLDLAQHLGRVVMLTGTLDPKIGLTKAEIVEVASPLLSFALKATLTGDDEPPAPPARGGRPAGRR